MKGYNPATAALSRTAKEEIIDIYCWKTQKVAEAELTVLFRLLFYLLKCSRCRGALLIIYKCCYHLEMESAGTLINVVKACLVSLLLS